MQADTERHMSLGDHLEELRKRLIRVLLLFFVFLILGFVFRVELRILFEGPLRVAAEAVGAEVRAQVSMPDPDEPMLSVLGMEEGPINDLKITMLFAFMMSMPVLLYQACCFVMPGLTIREQKAAFWMVPAAALFFYAGIVFGYFIGIPLLYEILIEYSAGSNRAMDLRESEYLRFFMLMTVSFGLVMDIPWAILVLVKAGLVSPDQLARQRKMILVGAVVAAAVLTPPDPMSQMFLFVLIVGLFEGGLLVSRFIGGSARAHHDIQHDYAESATAFNQVGIIDGAHATAVELDNDHEAYTDYGDTGESDIAATDEADDLHRHETIPDDELVDEEDWDDDDDSPIARPGPGEQIIPDEDTRHES